MWEGRVRALGGEYRTVTLDWRGCGDSDHDAFLTMYAAALAAARDSLDLTGLFQMLEHWRRVAALQAGPQVFRRVARRAAQLLTGQPSPEDEPLAVTREKAGGI